METGWLLRDGEVLASTVKFAGWRSRVVTPRDFIEGVGAVVVAGPAICWGVPVVRLGDASRLRTVATSAGVHLVGYGRHAVAVRVSVAAKLRPGDEVELRIAS